MAENKTQNFRLRIEPSLLDKLREVAEKRGESAASVVRMLIREEADSKK